MRITKQDLMPWEKTWFLYQSRYIGSYSLCVMMMVLLGYLFAHVDDGDGLLYLHMAKNMIQSQNPWLLFWSLKEHQGFYDHLPCIVWPIAAWLMIGGTPFVFAMYTAMSSGPTHEKNKMG